MKKKVNKILLKKKYKLKIKNIIGIIKNNNNILYFYSIIFNLSLIRTIKNKDLQ